MPQAPFIFVSHMNESTNLFSLVFLFYLGYYSSYFTLKDGKSENMLEGMFTDLLSSFPAF